MKPTHDPSQTVAIVGMAGRFPGAASVAELWRRIRAGEELIRTFSDTELEAAGVPEELRRHPRFVPARGVLEGIESFDAPFFGFAPREAALMDPQLRLFLETCWHALEDGGCDPSRFDGSIGVFGGVSMNGYLLNNLLPNGELVRRVGALELRIHNGPDFVTTWAAYRLQLRGPAVGVQTACSTSLVAVHLACQSLLAYECDAALAGAATVAVPQLGGYVFEEGGIFSPDGVCRPFDAAARGTVDGSGVGVVMLERLDRALEQGDPIYALIRASAINNDGSAKVGFMAPSLEAQAEVIATAQGLADVDPESIGFVEAHGTAMAIGDPIEVAALTRVFRESTSRRGFCWLGSVKANVGHLDQASGVTGLIKASLAVAHGEIPPNLHFERANPNLELAASPFRVPTERTPWPELGGPRRAAVSSFGVGGTNAHVVLEEPPPPRASDAGRADHLLLVSARSAAALERSTAALAEHLRQAGEGSGTASLADLAYTTQVGRKAMPWRRAVVCADLDEALRALDPAGGRRAEARDGHRSVALLFPGQGAQRLGMGAELYRGEPVYRQTVDLCLAAVEPSLRAELARCLTAPAASAGETLAATELAQPALFAVELALARLLMHWGLRPDCLIGHSVGEYVAATVAGVFTAEDGMRLLAERGRLMAALPRGAMLSVELPAEELAAELGEGLDLAAENAPRLSVASGPLPAIERLEARLRSRGVGQRRLVTSHAFHSFMVEPARAALAPLLAALPLGTPAIPLVSNLSGDWLTDAEATDPAYWLAHLRQPVRFAAGLATLAGRSPSVLVEVGPGRALSSLARQAPTVAPAGGSGAPVIVTAMPAGGSTSEARALLEAVAETWLAGVEVDWQAFHQGAKRRKERLPLYPFERQRHWIEPPVVVGATAFSSTPLEVTESPVEAPTREADPARRGHLRSAYQPPADEIEAALAGLWEELLGFASPGTLDDFFELGGHSLLATRLLGRVRQRWGVELPLEVLFAAPTVQGLAAAVRAAAGSAVEGTAAPPPEAPAEAPAEAPLSFQQQRLWFLDQLEPGNPAFNMALAVGLDGPLPVEPLAQALDDLESRQGALASRIRPGADGLPRAVAGPPSRPRLPVVDLSALSGSKPELAEALLARCAGRGFDLEAGPLWRAVLVRLGPREHALGLVFHHLISDAWSTGIVLRELVALYRHRAQGEALSLPALPTTYADYAARQRAAAEDPAGRERRRQDLDHWRSLFTPLPPVLELPRDRSGRPGRRLHGASRSLVLPAALRDALDALARSRGATLFMALLAAYTAWLGRLCHERDVTVGVPVANRPEVELEGLVGFFVNTLGLRLELDPGAGLGDLIGEARERALAAFRHQAQPFEQLVEALDVARDLDQNPLFQTLLTFQNVPFEEAALPGLTLRPRTPPPAGAMFDLALVVVDRGELEIEAHYAAELFDATTVERWLGSLGRLIERGIATPERPLGTLELLSPAERHQLLAEWSDTARATPDERSFVERFADLAGAQPDAVAVSGGAGALSYGDLLRRVDALATRLRRAGVAAETLVGLAGERSPETVVALLAILRAGGAFLPLDPAYPAERLEWMLADSRVELVLAGRAASARLPLDRLERPPRLLAIEEELAAALAAPPEPGAPAWPSPEPDQLCYAIYTSGSTGRPKAALLAHRGVRELMAAQAEVYGLGPGDRVLQFASWSFDASWTEVLLALAFGGELALADPAELLPGEPLQALLARSRTSNLTLTPSALSVLPTAGLEALRILITAGEPCPPDVAARWSGGRRLVNAYGPTETTVWATFEELRGAPAPGEAVSIGRPLRNFRLLLLDPRRQPVPIGAVGEVCLAGPALTRGYLGRPALTAERLIPDPTAGREGRPGGRIYRTGDLGRLRPDGRLELIGRGDQQVKVRGYRIELGEVEAAARSHPELLEAAAFVERLSGGPARLVLCFVPRSAEAPPSPGELRRHLAVRLPEHMLPSLSVSVAELPRLPNGKLDRRGLERLVPGHEGLEPATEAAAGGDLVERIAALWRGVLRLPRVGPDDRFFEIGGDSILSIQVVARARQEGLLFEPRDLFLHQSPRELARVARLASAPLASQEPAVGPCRLTPIQRWFFDLGSPEPGHWNQALTLELADPPPAEVLARALAALMDHHDLLRARFVPAAGGWQAEIEPPGAEPGLVELDLGGLASEEQEARLLAAASAAQAGFDLARGPLLRAVLARRAEQPSWLVLIAHHLVVDGVSWRILLGDLAALLAAARDADQAAALPPRTTSFAAWAEALAASAGEPWRQEAEAFWQPQLRSWSGRPLELLPGAPVGEGAPPFGLESASGQVALVLDAARTASLATAPLETYQATLEETLLAAWAAALGAWAGRPALVIGVEGHGREAFRPDLDLSRTVGWFTCAFPVPIEVAGLAPGDLLLGAKEALRRARRHSLGWSLMAHPDEGAAAALPAEHPLLRPPAGFNYLGNLASAELDGGLRPGPESLAGPTRSARSPRTHLVMLDAALVGGELRCQISHSLDRVDSAAAEALASLLAAELDRLVGHCSSDPVGAYSPSDFPDQELSHEDLGEILAQLEDPA